MAKTGPPVGARALAIAAGCKRIGTMLGEGDARGRRLPCSGGSGARDLVALVMPRRVRGKGLVSGVSGKPVGARYVAGDLSAGGLRNRADSATDAGRASALRCRWESRCVCGNCRTAQVRLLPTAPQGVNLRLKGARAWLGGRVKDREIGPYTFF